MNGIFVWTIDGILSVVALIIFFVFGAVGVIGIAIESDRFNLRLRRYSLAGYRKIRYRKSGYVCRTRCPFKMNIGVHRIHVASAQCKFHCRYFVKDEEENRVLYCRYNLDVGR